MTNAAYGQRTIWGCAAESTYGTAVTVSRFYEILPEDTVGRNNKILVSNGMRGGAYNLRRGSRRALSASDASGDMGFEVATTNFGLLFKHVLGSTAAPVVVSGTAYKQTHTLGSTAGMSLTLQKQLFDSAGNSIGVFTQSGAKVAKCQFSTSVDGFLKMKPMWDAQQEQTGISGAAASYPSSVTPFTFKNATVFTLNGTAAANVLSADFTLDRKLKMDRYFLGNAGLKSESLENDFPDITGSFKAEVLDLSFYNLFAGDTPAALVLQFTGGAISGGGGNNYTLKITIPEIHLLGETPKVSSAGLIDQTIGWEAAQDVAADPGMTFEYTSTDTTA